LTFDLCKTGCWVDTEGNLRINGKAARGTVVQKEREPLENYSEFVSATFRVKCTVERHAGCWQARHRVSLEFLDAIEPYIETMNKRRQIARIRLFYAERMFRKMFGERRRGGRKRTSLTHETASILMAIRRMANDGLEKAEALAHGNCTTEYCNHMKIGIVMTICSRLPAVDG
jgi:hypothetical protein